MDEPAAPGVAVRLDGWTRAFGERCSRPGRCRRVRASWRCRWNPGAERSPLGEGALTSKPQLIEGGNGAWPAPGTKVAAVNCLLLGMVMRRWVPLRASEKRACAVGPSPSLCNRCGDEGSNGGGGQPGQRGLRRASRQAAGASHHQEGRSPLWPRLPNGLPIAGAQSTLSSCSANLAPQARRAGRRRRRARRAPGRWRRPVRPDLGCPRQVRGAQGASGQDSCSKEPAHPGISGSAAAGRSRAAEGGNPAALNPSHLWAHLLPAAASLSGALSPLPSWRSVGGWPPEGWCVFRVVRAAVMAGTPQPPVSSEPGRAPPSQISGSR